MLISQKNAVTDWHQGFSGTLVFYLVLSGVKEFAVVEPTASNQETFKEWKKNDLLVLTLIITNVFLTYVQLCSKPLCF